MVNCSWLVYVFGWANETTKDITASQTLLRHSKPEMTAVYTHGNFPKALDAQRQYMEQLLAAKPASEAPSDLHRVGIGLGFCQQKQQPPVSGCAVSRYIGGRYRIRTCDFHRVKMALYR
jgi:hypothetical protein